MCNRFLLVLNWLHDAYLGQNPTKGADKMTNQITLEDFEQMLKQHDWTYMYSDDMRAWRKGKESESRIELAVKKDKTLNRFYKAYKHALDNRLERPTAKDFE